MIRTKVVQPDSVLNVDGQQIPYLSEEGFMEEAADIIRFTYLAGGGYTVQTKRYPVGANQSITLGCVIQWWSHTQQSSRAQPEQVAGLDDPSPEEHEAALEEMESAVEELDGEPVER